MFSQLDASDGMLANNWIGFSLLKCLLDYITMSLITYCFSIMEKIK